MDWAALERITEITIKRYPPNKGMSVPLMGFESMTIEHLPTGLTITVPGSYSRSELMCRNFLLNMLANTIIVDDLDPVRLIKK